MIMEYQVDRHHYDYFGGASKHDCKNYNTLQEGWAAYKRERANDFTYDDAWQHTTFRVIHTDKVVLKPQRPHARTEYEWIKLKAFMDRYECHGMSAAYVEQNACHIVDDYNAKHHHITYDDIFPQPFMFEDDGFIF
jgi:hypothetical protein